MQKSKEFNFFVKADLRPYKGKYIAIVEDKVVASGTNAKEVLEEAERKFPRKKPMLAKVPEEVPLLLGRTDVFNLFDICFRKNKKTLFTD